MWPRNKKSKKEEDKINGVVADRNAELTHMKKIGSREGRGEKRKVDKHRDMSGSEEERKVLKEKEADKVKLRTGEGCCWCLQTYTKTARDKSGEKR